MLGVGVAGPGGPRTAAATVGDPTARRMPSTPSGARRLGDPRRGRRARADRVRGAAGALRHGAGGPRRRGPTRRRRPAGRHADRPATTAVVTATVPIDAKVASRIVGGGPGRAAAARPTAGARDLRCVTLEEPAFPARLARGRSCRRHVLFVRGDVGRARPGAGGGGRRDAPAERVTAGRSPAASRAASSAADAAVVSGLAYGIDGAAHEADGPGRRHDGRGHRRRARRIAARERTTGWPRRSVATGGAVVSEYAPDVEPTIGHVPAPQPDHQRPVRRRRSSSRRRPAAARSSRRRGRWSRAATCSSSPGRSTRRPPRAAWRSCASSARTSASWPASRTSSPTSGSAPVDGRPTGRVAPARRRRRAPRSTGCGATERTVARGASSGTRAPSMPSWRPPICPVATVLATLTLLEATRRSWPAATAATTPDGELLGPSALPIPDDAVAERVRAGRGVARSCRPVLPSPFGARPSATDPLAPTPIPGRVRPLQPEASIAEVRPRAPCRPRRHRGHRPGLAPAGVRAGACRRGASGSGRHRARGHRPGPARDHDRHRRRPTRPADPGRVPDAHRDRASSSTARPRSGSARRWTRPRSRPRCRSQPATPVDLDLVDRQHVRLGRAAAEHWARRHVPHDHRATPAPWRSPAGR